jgi:hypothetical protein
MREIADLVSKWTGKDITVKLVSRDEHIRYYVKDRGLPENAVKWWAATYEAVKDGECEINDPTLDKLMKEAGIAPTPVEQTIKKMTARS